MNFEQHPHWPELQRVYNTLSRNGYKAYLAGGCVRDAILGRMAHDLDIATDATPEAIETLFSKTVAVGKAFGVMVVVEGAVSFEVATFRSDGSYKDGRHPENIVFTTPEDDARRRDFTINALFYDLNQGRVLDFVGGLSDLAEKKIRAVGRPEERFREDHLRILRALRFSAQLGFDIEEETLAAVKNQCSLVKLVSSERIHEEMLKLFKTQDPLRGLSLLAETGVGKVLFPNYQNIFQKSKKQHEILFSSGEKQDDFLWYCFLAPWALNRDLGWEWILDNYRFPRLMSKNLKRAIEQLENSQHFFLSTPGEQLSLLGEESSRLFLKLCRCLSLGGPLPGRLLGQWDQWGGKMPEPLVTGEDLKAKFSGRDLGVWLHKLYTWQLEGRFQTKDELLHQVP